MNKDSSLIILFVVKFSCNYKNNDEIYSSRQSELISRANRLFRERADLATVRQEAHNDAGEHSVRDGLVDISFRQQFGDAVHCAGVDGIDGRSFRSAGLDLRR